MSIFSVTLIKTIEIRYTTIIITLIDFFTEKLTINLNIFRKSKNNVVIFFHRKTVSRKNWFKQILKIPINGYKNNNVLRLG